MMLHEEGYGHGNDQRDTTQSGKKADQHKEGTEKLGKYHQQIRYHAAQPQEVHKGGMARTESQQFFESMTHHQYADANPEKKHGRVECIGAVLDR